MSTPMIKAMDATMASPLMMRAASDMGLVPKLFIRAVNIKWMVAL